LEFDVRGSWKCLDFSSSQSLLPRCEHLAVST